MDDNMLVRLAFNMLRHKLGGCLGELVCNLISSDETS